MNIDKFFDSRGRYLNRIKPTKEEEQEFLQKYNDSLTIRETIYRIRYDVNIHPKCPICGNPCKNIYYGNKIFANTCGNKSCSNKFRAINVKKSINEKYGVDCVFSIKEIQEKSYNTSIKIYGKNNYRNKRKRDKTNLERYGTISPAASKEIRDKIHNTVKERYGVDNPYQIPKVIEKIQEKRNLKMDQISKKLSDAFENKRDWRIQQIKNGMIEALGVDNPSKVPELLQKSIETRKRKYGHLYNIEAYKKNSLLKYGVDNPNKTPEARERCRNIGLDPLIQQKKYETMKKNHTFNSNKAEKRMYEQLLRLFDKDDIVYQYREERYPFNCDFYVKSKDLFIECNFYYTHGGHKYNENTIEDINKVNELKEKIKIKNGGYQNYLETWTIRDINKFNIAKQNNLNYLAFYSEKEMINWIEDELKNS